MSGIFQNLRIDLVWLELDLVLEVVGPMGWLVVVEVVDLSFVAVQFVGLVVGSRVVQEVVLGFEVEVDVEQFGCAGVDSVAEFVGFVGG